MPYIPKADRSRAESEPQTAGELNFAITKLLLWYMSVKGKSYASINDCIGALEGAKLEFYRRFAAPYEDTKIAANGDVF